MLRSLASRLRSSRCGAPGGKAWETKARFAAAATARERATALVETRGGKLGLPRSITDQTSGQAMATVSVALPAEGTLTIGSGDLSVTGLVSVQFDLRDEG
ncbi:MAG: hypothetical protein INH41_18960 [Myxococcaceae bacterium]|jgi:uncharacterized protein YggE|nr:hypothetical protein [Myxococcaceae bacterium]